MPFQRRRSEIRRRSRSSGFSLIELMTVIVVMMLLFVFLFPAFNQVREAARRTQCKNNLMQIGVALQNYVWAHQILPPGTQNDTGPIQSKEGTGYHMGWITQILPYIDQLPAYGHIDFTQSVYDPMNLSVRTHRIPILLCPSDPANRNVLVGALTSYYGVHNDFESAIDEDQNGVLFLNSSIGYEQIVDGSANTMFVLEATLDKGDGVLGWMSGTRSSLRNAGAGKVTPISTAGLSSSERQRAIVEAEVKGIQESIKKQNSGGEFVGSASSFHPGGSQLLLGDGSVRFLSATVGTRVFRNLAHREDGEMQSDF